MEDSAEECEVREGDCRRGSVRSCKWGGRVSVCLCMSVCVSFWHEIDYQKQTERRGACVLGWMQLKKGLVILEEEVEVNKHRYKRRLMLCLLEERCQID